MIKISETHISTTVIYITCACSFNLHKTDYAVTRIIKIKNDAQSATRHDPRLHDIFFFFHISIHTPVHNNKIR